MDLITLQEYKTAKAMSTKTDQDAQLSHLISVASDLIQTYLNRNFISTGDEVDYFSLDYDTDVLYLDKYPVSELVSINEIDPQLNDSTIHFPVDQSTYILDPQYGKLIRTNRRFWPQGFGAVVVTYRTVESTAENVPPAIKQAVIDLVTYYHKEEYKDSRTIMGTTVNNNTGTGTNANSPNTSFPPHIQRVLDLYK
jgi:hypothetical protein